MKKSCICVLATLAIAGLLWGCNDPSADNAATQKSEETAIVAPSIPAESTAKPVTATVFTGPVLETMDTGGYTYVLVDTGTEKIWGAAPQFEVAVGDEVSVPATMPMHNYYSKTLDRTFDVVYFAGSIGPAGAAPASMATAGGMGMGSSDGHPGGAIPSASSTVDFTGIDKAEGGHTVGELLSSMTDFSGKEVTVRGKVVKFNANIMGKNWIHVRDGSGEEGLNDLSVTTAAFAEVGDTVLIKGVASTDRDFGYGYKYAFIVEDAKVEVE